MSNEAHYSLERRVKARLQEMDANQLRERTSDFVDIATVDTVRLLATYLNVPLTD